MEFNQLKTFIAVVETGSFSRAGEKLFLSQPTVTTQIKLLEKELAKQLLVRSTNGIITTEAGKYFFDYAQRALRERENLLAQFGTDTSGVQRINVAASSIPGQYVLPSIIAAFRLEHPELQINLKICNSALVCKALTERQADLGMCGSTSFQGEYNFSPVLDDPLVVITPNIYPYNELPQGENFPASLLKDSSYILREEGSGSRREFEKWCQTHEEQWEVKVAGIMNDNQAIKKAVAAGAGISVISARAVATYVKLGQLLSFPLEGSADRKLYLVERKKFKLLGGPAVFAQYVQKYLKKGLLKS